MRVEDEWIAAGVAAWANKAGVKNLSDHLRNDAQSVVATVLAAVAPLIAAAEREAIAAMCDERVRELQANIDDNIAEVRVIETTPADNRPLIKARDWFRHFAAAIRARGEGER